MTDEGDPVSCDPRSTSTTRPTASRAAGGEPLRAGVPGALPRGAARARRAPRRRARAARARAAAGRSAAARPRTGARSIATDFLFVYRTDADPRCVDLSLDPSERDYGSLWGLRPDWINYGGSASGGGRARGLALDLVGALVARRDRAHRRAHDAAGAAARLQRRQRHLPVRHRADRPLARPRKHRAPRDRRPTTTASRPSAAARAPARRSWLGSARRDEGARPSRATRAASPPRSRASGRTCSTGSTCPSFTTKRSAASRSRTPAPGVGARGCASRRVSGRASSPSRCAWSAPPASTTPARSRARAPAPTS